MQNIKYNKQGYANGQAIALHVEYAPILSKCGLTFHQGNIWLTGGGVTGFKGWVIFISCVTYRMPELLHIVAPVLLRYRVAFRVVKNQLVHYMLNAGELDIQQFGKVVAIYPETLQDATGVVNELQGLTVSFRGPLLADCVRLGAVLYAGYISNTDNEGSGTIKNPKRKYIPFASDAKYINHKPTKIIGKHFVPFAVIAESAKVGIFKAVNIKGWALTTCIIKRGRAYTADDNLNRNVKHRLQWEMKVMESLRDVIPVPHVIDLFEYNEDTFLVMDYIGYTPMRKKVQGILRKRKWVDLSPILRADLLQDYREILTIVEKIHACGYVHRDLTDTNFLIPKRGAGKQIYTIDFELAYDLKNKTPSPAFVMGTPGYVSPEQLAGAIPTTREDIRSLGALLLFIVTGILPKDFIIGGNKETREKLDGLQILPGLVDLIMLCMRRNPMERPTIERMYKVVTGELKNVYL
jgi:serine/threonine protein kinase